MNKQTQAREIKFRVWWKNQMLEVSSLADLCFKDGQYFTYNGTDEPYVFLQFTGLKDKKGREIFEGDILLDEYNKEKPIKTHVFWNKIYCAFLLSRIEDGQAIQTPQYSENNTILMTDMEIIGNIYENPSLLSPSK